MAGIVAVFSLTSCDTKPKPGTSPPVLIISGDTGPWIVPCGCTANQAGGLARRATVLQQQGGQHVYLEVGGAAAGTTEYFREKFTAVLLGEKTMNVAAHNLGKAEIALGADVLQVAAQDTGVPFISANAKRANGTPLAPAVQIIGVAGRKVAIVGVVSPKFATADVRVDDPRTAILAALPAKGSYDSLIVLAYLPEDELAALATSLPEADAIVGGPTGQAISPRYVGPTLLASATNKGKFLVKLTGEAKGWRGETIEVAHTFGEDAKQQENLKRYLSRLDALDIAADETGLMQPIANAPASYKVAGSESCIQCHQADSEAWALSKHAHAGETLKAKGFHVDAYCLQCHSTGFGLPGGFASIKRTATLAVIGCESCHGPSAAHAKEPTVRTPFAAFDQCIRCHDQENSPTFNRDTYWAKIKHGKKGEAK